MHKLLDDCEKDKLNKSLNTILADIQDKIGTLDTKQITNITELQHLNSPSKFTKKV
jgi:hypothetical protein